MVDRNDPRIVALDAELATLNAEVEAAVRKRTAWMDAHMSDYAEVQVGEPLYDLTHLRHVGTVTRLYRYWGPNKNGLIRDHQYDTHMSVEYEFLEAGTKNFYDNTSRHGGATYFGSEERYRSWLKIKAEVPLNLTWEDVFK